MSKIFESACRPFTAGAALSQYLRVKLSSGKLAAAGAADQSLGTIEEPSFADGDVVGVRVKTAQGTRRMVAGGAITLGATVYGAASGKISATANGNVEGIALEAAGADGDVIEVLTVEVSDAALSVGGVAAGYKIARGEIALDGSNPTPVATGLTTVVSFHAMLKGTAAPGDSTSVLSADISGATVNVYAWKTDGTDPTFIASTGTETIYWSAIGT